MSDPTDDTILPPLRADVAITDSTGRPSAWFIRFWNQSVTDRIGGTTSPSLPSVAAGSASNGTAIDELETEVGELQTQVSGIGQQPPARPVPRIDADSQNARLQRLEALYSRLNNRVNGLEQDPR